MATKPKPQHPAAGKRRADEGQIARSPDVTAALLLLSTLLLLKATGDDIVGAMKAFVSIMFSPASFKDLDTTATLQSFVQGLGHVAIALAPLLIGTVVVAILGNILQVGLVFNPGRLAPNFEALNPTRGFSRIFGGGMKPLEMLINVVKLIVLALVAYSALSGRIGQIVTAQRLSFTQLFLLGSQTIFAIALRLAIAFLIIAIVEYVYQRWQLEQKLKMSKYEIKEEMRRMEGDPKIKLRRRQIAMQRLQQKLKKEVPTADVIVTNPTHYAVALKYDSATMRAPRVVAKGQDYMALRIREIAVAHDIPILERKPLARALYGGVDVGEEIPEEFFSAVAEILAYVYELSGKTRRKVAS